MPIDKMGTRYVALRSQDAVSDTCEQVWVYPTHPDDTVTGECQITVTDSIYIHILNNIDVQLFDTVTENSLPWHRYDTLFNNDADTIFIVPTPPLCDSIIYYNLFIFWNGDHCDTALSYPNVVTSNGDGTNDRFVIDGLIEHNCFKYNELTIYDRYGHCVYHKRNIATEDDWWDPSAQRAPAGTDFYYFNAHGVNIWTQHRGVIEVLREK